MCHMGGWDRTCTSPRTCLRQSSLGRLLRVCSCAHLLHVMGRRGCWSLWQCCRFWSNVLLLSALFGSTIGAAALVYLHKLGKPRRYQWAGADCDIRSRGIEIRRQWPPACAGPPCSSYTIVPCAGGCIVEGDRGLGAGLRLWLGPRQYSPAGPIPSSLCGRLPERDSMQPAVP